MQTTRLVTPTAQLVVLTVRLRHKTHRDTLFGTRWRRKALMLVALAPLYRLVRGKVVLVS